VLYENKRYFSPSFVKTLKLSICNTGVVVVNSKVVGLGPGLAAENGPDL
jgi:hypothetical protein